MPNQEPKSKPEDVEEPHNEGLQSTALFGVAVWNPLDAGIKGVPLMVPAHEYNRVASNLADALSLALQYVPHEGYDADEIRRLERDATIPPNADVDLPDTAAQDSASKSNSPAVSG
jgi:hypothetical protein